MCSCSFSYLVFREGELGLDSTQLVIVSEGKESNWIKTLFSLMFIPKSIFIIVLLQIIIIIIIFVFTGKTEKFFF